MSIKLGNTAINKLYLGSTEIKKAYLGSALIFDNTGSPSIIPLNNIISEYKFEDNVFDTVGSNNGVATNITYVNGLVDKSASFESSSSSGVEIAHNDNLSFGNGITDSPFSLSFTVNFTSINNPVLLTKKDVSSGAINEYQIDYSGLGLQFYIFDNNVSNYHNIIINLPFNLGQWYHFTFTYSGGGTNNDLNMYIDGVLQAVIRKTVGTYVSMHNTGEPMTISKNAQNTGRSLNGLMDVVRIWDVELSQIEITELATKELLGVDINP